MILHWELIGFENLTSMTRVHWAQLPVDLRTLSSARMAVSCRTRTSFARKRKNQKKKKKISLFPRWASVIMSWRNGRRALGIRTEHLSFATPLTLPRKKESPDPTLLVQDHYSPFLDFDFRSRNLFFPFLPGL